MSAAKPPSTSTNPLAEPTPANGSPSTKSSIPPPNPPKSEAKSTPKAKSTSSTKTASSSAPVPKSTPAPSSPPPSRSMTTSLRMASSTTKMPNFSSRASMFPAGPMALPTSFPLPSPQAPNTAMSSSSVAHFYKHPPAPTATAVASCSWEPMFATKAKSPRQLVKPFSLLVSKWECRPTIAKTPAYAVLIYGSAQQETMPEPPQTLAS